MITSSHLWAKLKREGDAIVSWHSLVDHSADVAAVVEALLKQPTIRRRLAGAAGLKTLDPLTCARLAALAFLHDIGKANRGFRARVDPRAETIGHIDQLSWVFNGSESDAICEGLTAVLGLDRLGAWFAEDATPLLETLFAHHGRPWKRGETAPFSLKHWRAIGDDDPVAKLAPMRDKLDLWFEAAFAKGPPLPDVPAFQHAFAGLLMLADWLGSDEAAFCFANGEEPDRMAWARRRAPAVLHEVGLAIEPFREAVRAVAPDFAQAFGGFGPRAVQRAVTEPDANLVVVEAETGSGKTEAALWRFKTLFEAGLVDGLYFALPTRVAATQIFARVKTFRDRVFPVDARPGVVLAVPGQARFDDAEARPLPGFGVQWSDDARDAPANRERWAAEHPKRFLAATIAVGTIDQALLGSIAVKHAHMRGTALMRQLLVVDEVHASDVYMEKLLANLLRSHIGAGGQALLLSATLGAGMRARLLGTAMPEPETAAALPYPALSWAENGQEVRLSIAREGRDKRVHVEVAPVLKDAAAVASLALDAARRGAAVLVIRNTVAAAIETAQALEALTGPDSPLLFRVEDIATLHHSRFALEDRRLLDAAVEAAMGPNRPAGAGRIVVGTQTLEISLDLDADLLVTDLCPIDVLLQRVGRLHRHTSRPRPEDFAEARAVVLVPDDRDLRATKLTRYGLGPLHEGDGVYPDLRVIEATWRLLERHPAWDIPAMNRILVEGATHPSRLLGVETDDPGWKALGGRQEGIEGAKKGAAHLALLDRSKPFNKCEINPDERLATRLGAADRLVTFDPPHMGPFGVAVTRLRLPAFLAKGIGEDADPQGVMEDSGELSFRLGEVVFSYNRYGLRRNKSPA